MNKYGPKAQDYVGNAMQEMHHGKLKYASGKKVTTSKQAGGKVPKNN